jgi:NAD dependent epimerase/dehydratase
MKALVTGAAGFIGSHLTEELVRKGWNVRAMTRYNFQNNWGWLETLPREILNEVEIHPSDVTDPFAVRKAVAGCDVVYHLAALIAIPYSYRAPASYVQTNVTGTLNVLEACLDEGVKRLVHTSTSEVYGTAQYTPIDEKHPLAGQSPYSASKIAADKLAESYYHSFGLPVAIARPFNTFGPRQSARAVIPSIMAQALSGAEVVRLGSLTPIRDLNWVGDTVAGMMALGVAEGVAGLTVNLGRGDGISVGDIAGMILKLCGSKARIEMDPVRARPDASEVFNLVCDSSLARKTLGWSPLVSLEKGLEMTVGWMKDNLSLYKPSIYNV